MTKPKMLAAPLPTGLPIARQGPGTATPALAD